MRNIRTVADLREALRTCEDDEPVTFKWWHKTPLFGEVNGDLTLTNISSTAGGRAIIIWFADKEEREAPK